MELAEKLVKEYNNGFSAGHTSAMREYDMLGVNDPQPTDLTQDQAIRAKALEQATAWAVSINSSSSHITHDGMMSVIKSYEDYIRDGRKGDE